MTSSSKTVLKISIIAYIVVQAIGLIKLLQIDEIEFITQFSTISIPITTLIILAYAGDKGEDKLCKIGLVLVGINIIITILSIMDVVSFYHATTTVNKIVATIKYISSGGITLCGTLALFSIIPNKDERIEILKVAAIFCYGIHILINCVEIFINISNSSWIISVNSLFLTISYIAEYSFIVAYLLNKTVDPVAAIKQENPQLQNTTVAPQQLPTQPLQQPMVPTSPQFQRPMGMPQQPMMNPQMMTQPPMINQQPQPMGMPPVIQQPVTPPMGMPQPVMQQPVTPPMGMPQPGIVAQPPVQGVPQQPVANPLPQINTTPMNM